MNDFPGFSEFLGLIDEVQPTFERRIDQSGATLIAGVRRDRLSRVPARVLVPMAEVEISVLRGALLPSPNDEEIGTIRSHGHWHSIGCPAASHHEAPKGLVRGSAGYGVWRCPL